MCTTTSRSYSLYLLLFLVDHSRVKLTSNKGEGDYINANFIPVRCYEFFLVFACLIAMHVILNFKQFLI